MVGDTADIKLENIRLLETNSDLSKKLNQLSHDHEDTLEKLKSEQLEKAKLAQ